MNKNEKIAAGTLVISLIAVCVILSIVVLADTEGDKSLSIEESLIFDTLSLSMENVYATEDCSEALQKIKDKHWANINTGKYKRAEELSWFAAGLVLGAHYVAKDCNTAESIIDQYIDDLWIADHDIGQSDIRDDIAAAMRFVKRVLQE